MRKRISSAVVMSAALAALTAAWVLPSQAQSEQGFPTKNGKAVGNIGQGGKGNAQAAPRDAPRLADGHISFGPAPGEMGTWNGSAGATLTNRGEGGIGNNRVNLPTNLMDTDVPFLPWAKALYEHRRDTLTADDPHVRCKSSGGARLYHTPYGFEVIQVPEMQQIFIAGVGGPHTYRTVYMDGRGHPEKLDPSYHGHSIGRWEGDKLIVDTVGFNTRFWVAREGYPTTSQLHTIETFERPDYNLLRYEVTIDDPGAYTMPWKGGWAIPFSNNNEMYEYICQENNRDSGHMFGGDVE